MKIFISHSSKDSKYGSALVELLVDIGIPHESITFTSDSVYGIPAGENIFRWLKNRISEKPFVIYLLSRNYYSSIACLNEMGAAWIIESQHVSIFTPDFDVKSTEFLSGALDPREIGFFVSDDDRVTEFTESMKEQYGLSTLPVVMGRARKKFMTRVAQIETGENTFTQGVPEREEHKPLALRESHPPIKLDDPIQKTASVRVPVPAPATAGKLGPVEKFLSDLKAGKLKDEEVMILQYAYDTGRAKFGVGWRTSEEVARILGWEEINDVSSILSKNYDSAIKRLDLRKLTTVSETTSYGNPREVELIHDMQTLIFDLPDYFSEKIAEIVKTDKEKKEQAKDDEIPF